MICGPTLPITINQVWPAGHTADTLKKVNPDICLNQYKAHLTFSSQTNMLFRANLAVSTSWTCISNKKNPENLKIPKAMIVVKVTYTVRDEYVSTNEKLIQEFLTDFKALDNTQFLYTILQSEDSKTFIHISQYTNNEIQQTLLNTGSFLHFQEQRDKNLASEPNIEFLNFTGSSKALSD